MKPRIDKDCQKLIDARDKGDTYENPHDAKEDAQFVITNLEDIKYVQVGQRYEVVSVNRRNGKVRLKFT